MMLIIFLNSTYHIYEEWRSLCKIRPCQNSVVSHPNPRVYLRKGCVILCRPGMSAHSLQAQLIQPTELDSGDSALI